MANARTLFLILVLAVWALRAPAQQRDSLEALKHLSLDQLMHIEVTSVSKRPERLSEAASAIQVITQDDIRQSQPRSSPIRS